jgi:hypothetical protein
MLCLQGALEAVLPSREGESAFVCTSPATLPANSTCCPATKPSERAYRRTYEFPERLNPLGCGASSRAIRSWVNSCVGCSLAGEWA